jgi:hypothetical protein
MTRKPKAETPIDEIHRIRREISDRFGGDIVAIINDATQRQAASARPIWQPKTTNHPMHAGGEVERRGDA